ncbi:MAG TPA: type IV pilus secretin PilQ [Dissulfurispiraceae bacterium]
MIEIKNRRIIRHRSFILLFAALAVCICCGAAAAGEPGTAGLHPPEIKGIEILDHTVRIKIDGPVKYKIYTPEDPFRVAVDLEGIGLGQFREKIFSDKAGITDITPVQVQLPSPASRLNILLPSLSTITPEATDGMLVLHIKEIPKEASAPKADAADNEQEEGVANEITRIKCSKTDEGAEIVIKGNGTMPSPAVFELGNKLVIDIPGLAMKAALPASFPSPLTNIKYRIEESKVRFILDTDEAVDAEAFALEDEVSIDISSKVLSKSKAESAADTSRSILPKADDDDKNASKLISLDFQDADIIPILRLLSDVSGYNIVIHPDVKGKITMKLNNVPWEQALDIILRTFNLEKVVEGNVIRIATLKVFQDEKKAVAETKDVFGKAENIVTKVFMVNYANVDKVKDAIDKAKLLSPRGNISTDPRTRSMIIKDIPSSLGEIQKLIETLDKPTQQVLIEARIVEVSSNFSNELGVEWGAKNVSGNRTTTIAGSAVGAIAGGQGSTAPTLFPLGTSNAPTGAFTIGYLNPAQTFGLDLRLSAMENSGKGRVVSSPRIMTLDNEKAVMKQGRRIPYSTVSQSGTQVQFIDASLDLIVTPQIGPDKTILLNIQANKNEADFSNTSQGMPSITTSEASTQVLVKDGETVVIGGILKVNESEDESSVPGISKVPVLGWLFKRNLKSSKTEEQLIFITPRIVK